MNNATPSENQEALAAERTLGVETAGSAPVPELIQKLTAIADEIFEKWDKDQRSGKLLLALSGALPRYRADVSEIRCALATHQNCVEALIAASHALKSYAYGNSSPDLALDIAIKVDAAITLASGGK